MKRLIFLLCLFSLFIIDIIAAPSNLNKLDAQLRYRLKQVQQNPNIQKELSQQNIHVFVQGEDLLSIIPSQNGELGTSKGNWITAQIPFSSITQLIEFKEINQIKLAPKIYFKNDQVIERTGAKKAHEGQSPLSTSYTGKGVIVGIIDSGIDVTHPDFQNADGSTKILYLWDQNVDPANSPPQSEGYDYGQEWTQSQINDGICTHEDIEGHGTHVSGTAASNGRAVNNYQGTAPEANLIVVAINPFSSSFVDAASYIYQKADDLGKPCVINASLGWHSTYHDGTDADALMIDAMVEEKSGRLFCAAAGNEGMDLIHLTPQASSDEKWTYYFTGPDGLIQLYIRLPIQFLESTSFAVGVDESDINPEFQEGGSIAYQGKTNWYTISDIMDNQGVYKNLKFDTDLGGRVSFEAEEISDSTLGLIINIEEDTYNWNVETGEASDLELWRLYIKNGDPSIDVWIADLGNSYWDFPNSVDYLEPDNNKSVGMPAVANKIIAVGASVNRNEFTNKDGELLGTPSTPGDLAEFSSIGPTADNRLKPDIVAPGENVISALSQAAYDEGYVYDEEIVEGEQHFIAGGTSMASPAVAGCLALYLEKYPDADFDQVIAALQNSAKTDAFTGSSLPNNYWGYGKIDIFNMIQSTDVQNNTNVDMTFSLSNNYPNPFNPHTKIVYSLPFAQNARLIVYNTQGQEVSVLFDNMQSRGIHYFTIDGSQWSNGIYFYQLQTQTSTITKKMVLMK